MAGAVDGKGRIHVFLMGKDQRLHSLVQQSPGSWAGSSWAAGAFPPLAATGSPAVAANRDGRLEVFVRGVDNAVWHTWELTPGGAWATGWASLGGVVTSAPAVAPNADGRLEVLAVGADASTIYHQWQVVPGGAWSAWGPLGVVSSGVGVQQLSGVSQSISVALGHSGWANNVIVAVALGTDGKAYYTSQSIPNGPYLPWRLNDSMPAPLASAPLLIIAGVTGQLAEITSGQGGTQVIVAVQGASGFSAATSSATQTVECGSFLLSTGGWCAQAVLQPIAALSEPIGGFHVYGLSQFADSNVSTLGYLYILGECMNGSSIGVCSTTWCNWGECPNAGGSATNLNGNFPPLAVRNADGRVEVFSVGTDQTLWHVWQTQPDTNGLSWSSWASFGGWWSAP
jgi:hypothetical protein